MPGPEVYLAAASTAASIVKSSSELLNAYSGVLKESGNLTTSTATAVLPIINMVDKLVGPELKDVVRFTVLPLSLPVKLAGHLTRRSAETGDPSDVSTYILGAGVAAVATLGTYTAYKAVKALSDGAPRLPKMPEVPKFKLPNLPQPPVGDVKLPQLPRAPSLPGSTPGTFPKLGGKQRLPMPQPDMPVRLTSKVMGPGDVLAKSAFSTLAHSRALPRIG